MATYSNLSTFVSALCGYDDPQQYLDHVGNTVRGNAYTDLAALCTRVAAVSGNSYSTLTALMNRLRNAGNDVQGQLDHESSSNRNTAATQFSTLVTDVNAIETQLGLTNGDYSAATTLLTDLLQTSTPNDLGTWINRTTPTEFSNAATAVAALVTQANALDTVMALLGYEPDLYLDAQYRTNTTTDGGWVDTWTSIDGNAYAFKSPTIGQTGTGTGTSDNAIYDAEVSALNDKPALDFDGTDDYLRHTAAILTGSAGAVFLVGSITAGSAVQYAFSESKESDANNFVCFGENANEKPKITTNVAGGAATVEGNGTVTNAHLWTFASSGTAYTINVDGNAHSLTGTDDGRWFGDVTGLANTTIGASRRNTYTPSSPWDGAVACILAFDSALSTANISAIEALLMSRYGLTGA